MSKHGKAVEGHQNLQYWGPNDFIRVRMPVDAQIKKIVGKTELVKGLGTQSVPEAVRRARIPMAEYEARIAEAWLQLGKTNARTVIYMQTPRVSTAQFAKMLLGMNGGTFPDQHNDIVFTAAPAEPEIPLAGFTWRAGIELWADSHGDAPPTEESVDIYTGHLRRFMAWVGSDLMGDVTAQHVIDYPDVLSKGADGGRVCRNKTINNHMASIRAVFRVAAHRNRIKTDPTKGATGASNVHKLKVRKNVMTDRKGFERDDHAKLVAGALMLPHDDPRRWLWLLGCTYGGRVGEFADAKVSAVRVVHGRLCFDINEEHRNEWNGKPLPLKSEGSARLLPLRSVFEEWGFLKYVETIRGARGDDAPLFPMLRVSKYGKRRDDASDRCIAWMRELLDTNDRRLVFHSTRHTIKTFLRGRVTDQVMDAITGHDDGSVSFHYGETELTVMSDAIEAYIPIAAAA